MTLKAEIVPDSDGTITVKHIKKHARPKIRAAVMMGNVTLGSKAIGNLTGEYDEAMTWDDFEIPESIRSKFRTARYEGERFIDTKTKTVISKAQAVVALGKKVYYLP